MFVCTRMYVYVCVYMYVYLCTCMCVHVHVCMYMCTLNVYPLLCFLAHFVCLPKLRVLRKNYSVVGRANHATHHGAKNKLNIMIYASL